jgi:hypothetical protein
MVSAAAGARGWGIIFDEIVDDNLGTMVAAVLGGSR